MKWRIFITAFIFLLVVVALSLYDYFSLRNTALVAGPTLPASIAPLTIPQSQTVNTPVRFAWRLDSATPRVTDQTSVYWAEESSPSALTVKDSPLAVGYPNHLKDYTGGYFDLPSDFSGSVTFGKRGEIYFRYYGHVDGQHLWTDEYKLTIN